MNPSSGPAANPDQDNANVNLPTQKNAWLKMLRGWRRNTIPQEAAVESSSSSVDGEKATPPTEKWSLGILNDKRTEEVPGTVLLLSSNRNEPLGLRWQPERTSASSLPSPFPEPRRPSSIHSYATEKKTTKDGQILLDPQPDDSMNDPLNWPAWRRDSALLSLGFYCMLGGGMTPILAAGFNDVAKTFDISYSRVALTTGLYMMGLGLGSVVFSPTAILYGKRPVYLASAIMFVITSCWCAKAPNFANLVIARIFQGISVSPVECLPSATIAEIFFLHERAFRVGIYTLLLLGGKNIIPLVSAAIIQSLEWRWVFWIVAIVVSFGFVLLFLFVPETFWDRTPRPKSRRPTMGHRSFSGVLHHALHQSKSNDKTDGDQAPNAPEEPKSPRLHRPHKDAHVGFVNTASDDLPDCKPNMQPSSNRSQIASMPETPHLHSPNSPWYLGLERNHDYLSHHAEETTSTEPEDEKAEEHSTPVASTLHEDANSELAVAPKKSPEDPPTPKLFRYTTNLRHAPPKTYLETLRPWNGLLTKTSWFRVMLRPFILFAYPSVLWSTLVYSLSVGWLIVLSESVASIYRNKASYNFSALGTGLVYMSPFVGGILGTAVAGKVSDIIVRFMARRNGGVYEPEFRLVMAAPVAVATAIGLMGFGWSAQERDLWIVPTIFFGIISFGCSLGSTTAITFCVDSYRQYAGEALVTLNFSKNIFHGLVFSLFFPHWLASDGPKRVFLTIGGIQIACLLTTIPMYIFGKRARMMTVRKNWMEKL